MTQNENNLVFVPLGGTGEIGMNCNLYGYGTGKRRDWIMVDLGVTFGRHTEPGIEIITADTGFIEAELGPLRALLLTHGHEDHIGAVAHLWPRLKCPVYATAFTAELVRGKLAEAGLLDTVPLHIVDPQQPVELGPFHIDYIGLTHSIAEPNALALRCGDARVLHTGDWKIDPDPVVGKVTEHERLRAFGDEGVDAIICDSTNVLSKGRSGSEADVATALNKVVAESTGRVVVTTFASNIARLSSIAKAAVGNGRHICLAGRGMHRIYNAARATGYLTDFPTPVKEEDAAYLPPERLVILCTGSQGEARAALGRMAHGHHPHLVLEAGDRVVFSSKMIPGNETEILALQNKLASINVQITTSYNNDLHVSGHPNRDELVDMYGWVRPRAAVPVHGEHRHLIAHAALAAELGVPQPLRVHNGDMVQLYPGPAQVLDTVPNGRLYLDGDIFTQSDALAVRERRRLSHNGVVFVSIPLDGANHLCGRIEVQMRGIPEHDGDVDLVNWALDAAERALPSSGTVTPARAEEEIGQHIRRELGRLWGKKPMVVVNFVNV